LNLDVVLLDKGKVKKQDLTPCTSYADMPFPRDMENASIYIMQNDKVVTLFEGSGAALQVAKKIEW